MTEDGREVAHGAEQIRDWVADQFARGVSFGVRAAVISPREIWTADEIAVDHPGPGQSGALHGRMVRYRLEGARIGSMDIIDVPGSTVYSPAPAF